jgi:diacylglycerol O-acyltransferase
VKQLSGLDAGFLYMETATMFGHISGLSIYEAPEGGVHPHDLVRDRIEARLPLLTPLRRRLVEVPFQLDYPWWIEDPDFDIDFHVRHLAVPAPGGERELADLVGRVISRPLDRSRPLWEAHVVEGLEGGQWALLLKIHHAAIDGAAGAVMNTLLLDAEPGATPPEVPEAPEPEPVPSPYEMMGRTLLGYAAQPQRYLAAQGRVLADAMRLAGERREDLVGAWRDAVAAASPGSSAEPVLPTGSAPRTPFNRSITPHRRFAYRSFSLDDVKAVKNHFGVTLNDTVMAVCAGALRRYLDRHEALPARPLVAAVPVSIRTGEEEDPWTNRVSSIFASLPTHLEDPGERVRFASEAMLAAKGSFDLVPADALSDLTRFSPPVLFSESARLMTRLRAGDRLQQVSNLVISTVPGPREALYMDSALLRHYYPVSTIAEGQGLNITVQSYQDRLDLGLVGCRELMPDLWHLVDDISAEMETLVGLAAAGCTSPCIQA